MKMLSGVLDRTISEYTYPLSRKNFLRIIMLATLSGAAVWVLAFMLDQFMVTPIFFSAVRSEQSIHIASYIALILVGIMMLPMLTVAGVRRPLVVVVAATVVLWDVVAWTGGPWVMSCLWTVFSSIFSYLAIIWINRIRGDWAAILFVTLFAILARVVLSL